MKIVRTPTRFKGLLISWYSKNDYKGEKVKETNFIYRKNLTERIKIPFDQIMKRIMDSIVEVLKYAWPRDGLGKSLWTHHA